MHRISPKSAKAAQKHAQSAKQHGQSIEAIAKEIQQFTGTHAEEIQQILKQSRSIQAYADASERYAAIAEQDDQHSTVAYGLAAEAHIAANREHIEIVRNYLKVANQLFRGSDSADW